MKILVCIPVVIGADVFEECLKQVVQISDVNVMVLLNGANQDVCDIAWKYHHSHSVSVIRENKNIYVTSAWNRFLDFFITSGFDRLVILNSDLTIQKGWETTLKFHPDKSIVPTVTDEKSQVYSPISCFQPYSEAPHPPGIFICLTKEQAKAVYPIPEAIRIWFNDSWIYSILNAMGQTAICLSEFKAYHHNSITVREPWADEIIQEDKVRWKEIVQPMLNEKIKQIQNG